MTRRELVEAVAFAYADFQTGRVWSRPIQPLDRHFAFGVGRSYCERGDYRSRAIGGYRYMDWAKVAQEARRVYSAKRRQWIQFHPERPR